MSNSGRGGDKNKKTPPDDSKITEPFEFAPIPIQDEQRKKSNREKLLFGLFVPIRNPTPLPITLESANRLTDLQNKPTLYQASALSSLLQTTPPAAINKKGERIIRFLLTTDKQLIFAREGAPSDDIPAHFQMANVDLEKAKCLTAGNAFFNEKGELCRLNHKSGDFRPPFDTLQFLMPLLVELGIPIADKLMIDRLDRNGGFIESTPLDVASLKEYHKRGQASRRFQNHEASSAASLLGLLANSASLSFEKLPMTSRATVADNSARNNTADQTRYLEAIKFIVNLLPSSSSTKKKYLAVIKGNDSIESIVSKLSALATTTLEKHSASKKEYSTYSTDIHKAIKEINLSDSFEKSAIASLLLEKSTEGLTRSLSEDTKNEKQANATTLRRR